MEKLIIDRQRWLHGEGGGDSYLLRKSDGKMCCIGFYCLQKGFTPEEIEQHSTPAYLSLSDMSKARVLAKPFIVPDFNRDDADSSLCQELTAYNDTPLSTKDDEEAEIKTEADREAFIIEAFSRIGIEVEFIN